MEPSIGREGSGMEMIVLPMSTAPFRARARPLRLVPAMIVIDSAARMDPEKSESVPSVAELPTCQNTLEASAPFVRMISLEEAAVRVESGWKI